ncbi:MAG: GNAT family N-acetyltransferase [Burkholderiales bacterium]|jgi:ribosomal protein S18 acetylase RimI-like enzyme|nr:GNAT family N-acetyltransferase [Burkholderiales bacterium]
MTIPARKLHLVRTLTAMQPGEASPHGLRRLTRADIEALGRLFYAAYDGTVDYEGETEPEAVAVVRAAFDGDYGAFVEDASMGIERDRQLVSASLVTMWNGKPLLAFAVTAPEWKGRGLSRQCVAAAMQTLAAAGQPELHLFVTASNLPALAVYKQLGFANAGAA